jgi:hypothetical protein
MTLAAMATATVGEVTGVVMQAMVVVEGIVVAAVMLGMQVMQEIVEMGTKKGRS